jgi:hypothetical protein
VCIFVEVKKILRLMQSKQSKQGLFRGLSKKILGGNVFLASVALCVVCDIETWEE